MYLIQQAVLFTYHQGVLNMTGNVKEGTDDLLLTKNMWSVQIFSPTVLLLIIK